MKTLTLTLMTGPAAGTARRTDGTRSFSVGTGPDHSWVLPADNDAPGRDAIVIRRAGEGFVIESRGTVTLGGHPVGERAEVALHHGAEVMIGAHLLSVGVNQQSSSIADGGQVDAFRDAAQPTISAILADVSPGGEAALGPLPGRTGEEWLDSLTDTAAQRGRSARDWSSIGAYGDTPEADDPLMRSEPRDPLSGGGGRSLPDDWNAPTSDSSNRIAQDASNRQSVRLGRAEAAPTPRRSQSSDARILREAAGLYDGEVDAPDEIQLANAGTALASTLSALAELERTFGRALGDLDLSPTKGAAAEQAAFDPGAILSDLRGDTCIALARRIAALNTRQAALIDGLLAIIAEARDSFDPDAIAAGVAARGRFRDRLRPGGAAWEEHKRRWAQNAAPLDPETLRATLAAMIDDVQKET
ncbi:hypothetical protein [uncultured Roseobacter sp.]|uniref:hypothetical protein n=1 Tax=uncultured Roseobacter sp. TaxID=114847 RepID=UPI00261F5D93|nr:hypothetical protein [uncultured Roseobacter sp.]